MHPITEYDHYREYIGRILESPSPKGILNGDDLRMIAETSGTSGSRRLLPVTIRQTSTFFLEGITVVFDEMFRSFPRCFNLRKSLKIMFVPSMQKCEANGLMIGPNSSSPKDKRQAMQLYTTPKEAYITEDEQSMLFLHALFALKDPLLDHIEANFCSYVFNFLAFIERHHEDLVEAIETGTIPFEKLKLTDDTPDNRMLLQSWMRPDPARAARLRALFSETQGRPVMTKVWPKINCILASETGSFALYGSKLRERYMQMESIVPIYSPIYAASEGLLGVNLDSSEKAFTLLPRAMFFEFVPVAHMHELQPKTLFMEELTVGEEYELIVTNVCGLFRYRIGDVVKCVGYSGQCPQVEVRYRKGQLLNVRGENSSEADLYSALTKGLQGIKMVDYLTIEPPNLDAKHGQNKPHYAFFVELQSPSSILGKETALAVDEALRKGNEIYDLFRKKGMLLPCRIHAVESGTFDRIRQGMIANGSSANQVKIPRVLRDGQLVRLVQSHTLP
jgi:hypothetical protein